MRVLYARVGAGKTYRMARMVMVEPIGVDLPREDETIALEGDAARAAMEVGADIIKVAYPGPELTAARSAELRVALVILGARAPAMRRTCCGSLRRRSAAAPAAS